MTKGKTMVTFGIESKFVKSLYDNGIIPPNTKRTIIDIRWDEPVMIYNESYIDGEKLDRIILTDEILNEFSVVTNRECAK